MSTVYFGTLAGNDHTPAMSHSLLAVAGAVLAFRTPMVRPT